MQPEAPTPESFRDEATELLESIQRARKRVERIPGLLDGTLDRLRDRIDRLIRESEVDNWRQVRIFTREADTIAADLAKVAKEGRLAPRFVAILDVSLRKAKKRDFWGARKTWRKLDRVAEQIAEVRRLQSRYREMYREVESHVRSLRQQAERLERVPRPPASPEDAKAFNIQVDGFNAEATNAYLDFLARSRADVAIPLLLEVGQGGGIGIPAPPADCDLDPILNLLRDEDPQKEAIRTRSFYGLLELPGYSDAKLAHLFGDSRAIRGALEEAWPWLKAIREDERRSLLILWSEDAGVLRRRMPALVAFLERLGNSPEGLAKGTDLMAILADGRFERFQTAIRMYTNHGADAERKWRGELEEEVGKMRKEAAELAATLGEVPEPTKVESGTI